MLGYWNTRRQTPMTCHNWGDPTNPLCLYVVYGAWRIDRSLFFHSSLALGLWHLNWLSWTRFFLGVFVTWWLLHTRDWEALVKDWYCGKLLVWLWFRLWKCESQWWTTPRGGWIGVVEQFKNSPNKDYLTLVKLPQATMYASTLSQQFINAKHMQMLQHSSKIKQNIEWEKETMNTGFLTWKTSEEIKNHGPITDWKLHYEE